MTMYVTDFEAKAILANLDSIFDVQKRTDNSKAIEHVKTLHEFCAMNEKLKNKSITSLLMSVVNETHNFGSEAHIISFYANKLGYVG